MIFQRLNARTGSAANPAPDQRKARGTPSTGTQVKADRTTVLPVLKPGSDGEHHPGHEQPDRMAPSGRQRCSNPYTALALLVLPHRPLVALDRQTGVLAGRHRPTAAPLRRPLTHQLTPIGVDSPALLEASQGWSCGDKARLQAAKQQELSP